VSAPWSSRSTRSDAGREPTRSVSSRAGTVVAPSTSILPGTQYVIPISRLVAVSLRPASSVRSRTLASTGRVLRLETARETTDRPRARFSCMTESFTGGGLQKVVSWRERSGGPSSASRLDGERTPPRCRSSGGMIVLSSHPVIIIIMPWIEWTGVLVRARPTGGGPAGTRGRPRAAGGRAGDGIVDRRGRQPGRSTSARRRRRLSPFPSSAGRSPVHGQGGFSPVRPQVGRAACGTMPRRRRNRQGRNRRSRAGRAGPWRGGRAGRRR
jgi:hypothetical protein